MTPEVEIEALWHNLRQVERRLREVEDRFDTLDTSWWRRLMFRIDGWGPWYRLRERPRPRPWRRWWTS